MKLKCENYKTNSTIYVYDEFENQEDFYNIDFDGLEFDNGKDLEEFIKEKISEKIDIKKIDEDNFTNVVNEIYVAHTNLIK